MPSFNCDGCGDVIKKPKLDAHSIRCKASVTCLDCSTTFQNHAGWKSHTSCISEAQKYEKSLYKPPKPKTQQDKQQHPEPLANSIAPLPTSAPATKPVIGSTGPTDPSKENLAPSTDPSLPMSLSKTHPPPPPPMASSPQKSAAAKDIKDSTCASTPSEKKQKQKNKKNKKNKSKDSNENPTGGSLDVEQTSNSTAPALALAVAGEDGQAKAAPVSSAVEKKNQPKATLEQFVVGEKDQAKAAPTVSVVGKKDRTKTTPAASGVAKKERTKVAPVASEVGEKDQATSTPATSVVGKTEPTKVAPVASEVGEEDQANGTPATSVVGKKERTKVAPVASEVGEKDQAHNTPATSVVGKKGRTKVAPVASEVGKKDQANDTPATSVVEKKDQPKAIQVEQKDTHAAQPTAKKDTLPVPAPIADVPAPKLATEAPGGAAGEGPEKKTKEKKKRKREAQAAKEVVSVEGAVAKGSEEVQADGAERPSKRRVRKKKVGAHASSPAKPGRILAAAGVPATVAPVAITAEQVSKAAQGLVQAAAGKPLSVEELVSCVTSFLQKEIAPANGVISKREVRNFLIGGAIKFVACSPSNGKSSTNQTGATLVELVMSRDA